MNGLKEQLMKAVDGLGMERVLWELASLVNKPGHSCGGSQNICACMVEWRNRYSSQFSHNLHHTTANDRNQYYDDDE